MRTPRPIAAALPALLAVVLASPLGADTPAPAPAPAAPAAPAPDTGWSNAPATPAAPMTTAAPTPAAAAPLRPPIVRRRGSAQAPASAAAPLPAAPSMATPSMATPAPAMTAAAPLPAPAAAPAMAPATAVAPAPSAPIVERMAQGPVAGALARILQLAKEHNIALDDGSYALGLRTSFTVDTAEGGSFRVWVSFTDRATGLPIRSTRPAFAKADGQAHVVTQAVASIAAGDTFDAPLLVPYEIFPNPGAGQSTEVQALVEVTREAGGGREVVVATAITTFRVHGS